MLPLCSSKINLHHCSFYSCSPRFNSFFQIFFSPLSCSPLLHAFLPECLCIVSPLQAERFITPFCTFYLSHLSSLSVHHCVFTQASSQCLYTCLSLTCMFCSCSLVMVDNPFIHFYLLQSGAFSSQHCHLLWHEGLNNGLISKEAPAVSR